MRGLCVNAFNIEYDEMPSFYLHQFFFKVILTCGHEKKLLEVRTHVICMSNNSHCVATKFNDVYLHMTNLVINYVADKTY